MARQTSKGNRYGRQGGGWLEDSPRQSTPTKAPNADEVARVERSRRELAAYEREHDLVPGTARYTGPRPEGGMTWEGAARMAHARAGAGLELSDRDREAVRRFPTMPPLVDA